jgi:hypothetical protein
MSATFGRFLFTGAGAASGFGNTMTGAGAGVAPGCALRGARRPDCASAVAQQINATSSPDKAIRRGNARDPQTRR